jgi:hypothetical protein
VTNAVDSYLTQHGQKVWELRITGETAGDTPLDSPNLVTKRHRVYGIFRLATQELFEKIGVATQGDAAFYSREQIDMTSQLEYDGQRYEIAEELEVNPVHAGASWVYILRRHPERIGGEA